MSRLRFMSKDLELLESGLFADAIVTCGGRTWKVHKSIICRCEWFKRAFAGKFEEARTNNVNISAEDFSPELVDSVISFIYSGVVSNIEKVDTNDSVVDACVRLWAIADFLVLKELQHEAITILEEHCDKKVKALCVMGDVGDEMVIKNGDYQVLILQLFRGVETAYTEFPHSVPCQQVLISFFHAVRLSVFGDETFSNAMSGAPRQFSHELLMAIIDSRKSNWVMNGELSEYKYVWKHGGCTRCGLHTEEHYGPFAMDLSNSGELEDDDWTLLVPWRCIPCFKKHGLKRARADAKP